MTLLLLFLQAIALAMQPYDRRCLEPLLDEAWHVSHFDVEVRRKNHVLVADDGSAEVLSPQADGSFKILKAPGQAEAQAMARAIPDPLDLQAVIDERLPGLFTLISALEKLTPRLELTARVKELESLKEKIFSRVRKRGAAFRLREIDDIVGARVAVNAPGDLDPTARRLASLEGFTVLKYDPIRYDRGYRAVHVTLRDAKGAVFEVQVMTRRMLAWVTWNAKRVYKPRLDRDSPYFTRLQEYDRSVIDYLNALDDGGPPPPRPEAGNLVPADHFPVESLR